MTRSKRVKTQNRLIVWVRHVYAILERRIDWVLVAIFMAMAAVPAIVNLYQPLWFDEVWRAHIISVWRLHRIDGEAPLPLLFMVLSKLVTLLYNNEVTQRIVYFTFGLALVPLLYAFGRRIRSRGYGLLLAGLIPWTYYYIEYISQDKVFLADITLSVLFLWLFHKYIQHSLRLRWFVAYCLLYMIGSTSSTYLFLAAGIWQLFSVAQQWHGSRQYDRESWKRLFAWTVPVGVTYVIYYFSFLKPQITPGLLSFWEVNQWKGQSLLYFGKYVLKHVASAFGLNVQNIWPNVGINYPVDGSGFLSFAPMSAGLASWRWVFAGLLAVWFVLGAISMIRRGFGIVPLSVVVVWVASLVLSYFAIAPFGNNRANIFMFGMMYMVTLLGIYETLAKLWGGRKVGSQTAFIVLVLILSWFFPLDQSVQRATIPRNEAYLDGMPTIARIVRAQSKPDDLIISYHYMTETSFGYYYNYDSAIRRLNNNPSENILYDRYNKSIPNTAEFFKELSKTHPVVWVVWGAGYGYDPTQPAIGSYTVSGDTSSAYVGVAKLTAK